MSSNPLTASRVPLGVAVVGGPTVVVDIGGLRFVSDPTFDPPQQYGALAKLRGPAVEASTIGSIDVVLISHADHADNLDESGRRYATAAPLVLTTPTSASQLDGNAIGLQPWEDHELPGGVRVTAVPAQHGPTDAERTQAGFINADVTGFVITDPAGRTIYISGDNASLRLVTEIHDRIGHIDVAILHGGAASVPAKYDGRPLSLSAERLAAAAEVLNASVVVVAHEDGWAHFTEGSHDVTAAFHRAGITDVLHDAPLGTWAWVDKTP